nr:reverse transcriptase domain-containing protein [Tanacetum cinerariifolium]
MHTRSKSYPINSNATILRRSNRRRVPNIVEPEIRTIEEIVPMVDGTMEELLQAPTEGYGEAIVIPEILAENFEIKMNLLQDVLNDAIKLMLFPYSLEGAARIWYEKEPPNSILIWDDLVNKFVNQFFPPSKTTHLKNEISRFTQRFEEIFREAWEHFKEMLRACPHHGFSELTQIDTFYNGLNEQDQDSLNAAAGGNLLSKMTREALKIIEKKSKVRYSRSKSNVSRVNTNSRDSASKTDDRIDKLTDQILNLVEIVKKQVITPATAKAVEKTCVICGGAHAYYNCIATDSNQPSVCAANERDTEESTDKENSNYQGSTAHIQYPVVLISIPKPDVPKTQPKPTIPYPSRLNDQKLCEKAMNQMEKFFQIFHDLHFDISFAGALLLMPKFASTIKSLLTNKDKLFELAKVPLNENYSAMLLKKLPENLGDPELTPTRMTLELADRSITRPKGVAEDVFIKVGKFHFPTNFVVVDFEADPRVPLILGRSFLRTGHALIDVYGEEITLRVNDESVTFNLNQTIRYSSTYDDNSVNRVYVIDIACEEFVQNVLDFQYNPKSSNPALVSNPLISEIDFCKEPIVKSSSPTLTPFGESETKAKSSIEEPSELELKELPSHLDPWVSPIHCVPKKGGMTVVANENNELIPTRLVTGWRVCIDYRKLNDATRKDHFPLPVMDQMLERLAGNEYYCFLDGFSGYCQIPIDPQDQEKTTFTCPYGTFAYRRMPFGLCNAPGTFQRCVIAIFYDMIEKTMEVFMDDFLVFRDSFSSCLTNLDNMLKCCEDTNLVLNWEKCHFMCREWIVLRHKILKSGIEVDRVKVDVIAKLPYPTTVKGVRSFLGHAGFYRRFIQDFFKIARPMTHLLEKETPFVFSKEYVDPFDTLKKKLTEAPILVVPDWNLPFELMCDASDFAIGAVLGQRKTKHFQPIYYASKTMTEAQIHYTTTEKEMLTVVYAFEKFRPYLVLSKSIVYTDHSAFKYLLNKQDAKSRSIISDRGTHFCNDQFTRVMIKYRVTHRLATAYHPRTSGQVEVSNRGLKRILERTVGENRASWSDKLDDALWAFHTAFKTPIGCTAYKLVYVKSCHLPIELEHKALMRILYENSVIYKERIKKLHDYNIKNRIFNVGDQVLLFNSRLNIFSGKLKTRWSGPFTITQVFPYGTVELSQPNGPNFKVNGHRVKHYFGGDIPFKVVLDHHTFPMDK